jgi:competence protein ComGC
MSSITSFLSGTVGKLVMVLLLVTMLIFLVILSITCYTKSRELDKATSSIQKMQEEAEQLRHQLELKEFENNTLIKGLAVAQEYATAQEKALSDESETKSQIIETIQSDPEAKDWWDTEIPSGVLDILSCRSNGVL